MDAISTDRLPKPTETRLCKKCDGPMRCYWNQTKTSHGYWLWRCVPCYHRRQKERNPDYQQDYYTARLEKDPDFRKREWERAKERNPNVSKEVYARRKESHPEYGKESRAKFLAAHPEYPKIKLLRERTKSKGITIEQYYQMLEAQGGVCASCGNPETARDYKSQKVRELAIDHDHKTGEVRGLICTSCNLCVGNSYEDPVRLRAAADYIERWQSRSCLACEEYEAIIGQIEDAG